jgi:hypothetical protein
MVRKVKRALRAKKVLLDSKERQVIQAPRDHVVNKVSKVPLVIVGQRETLVQMALQVKLVLRVILVPVEKMVLLVHREKRVRMAPKEFKDYRVRKD